MFGLQRLEGGKVNAHLFDAGGSGLAAATTAMAVTKLMGPKAGLLMPQPGQAAEPDQVLAGLDRSIGLKGADNFFSMQMLQMDAASGTLKFSSVGGKPYALLLRQSGGSSWLVGERQALIDGGEGFHKGETQLKKGDRVFLFSGGVSGCGASEGKPFGEARVESLLLSTFGHDLSDSIAALEGTLEAYSSDLGPCSILGLEYLGQRSAV